MIENKKSLLTIFLIVFIDLLGFGIILPLLPYIAENFSASPGQIGALVATYSLFQFISSPILGKLSDRFGRRRLLALSQFGSAIGFLLLGLANSLPLLFISRAIDGITGGNLSIAQAYVADLTSAKNRARGMGILGAAFGLGFMFGPALGGILSQHSFSTPAYFAAILATLTALATLLFLQETVPQQQPSRHTRFSLSHLTSLLKLQPLGILITSFFLLSFGFSGIQGTFALWVERSYAWGPGEVGYIFALIGAVSITTQIFLLPYLVKKYGERKVLKIAVPLLSAGFFWFPLATSPLLLPPANILIALGNGLANPTIQSIASESVRREEYGETMGYLQSAGSLGRIAGPVLAGWIFSSLGKNSPFLVSGTILALVALLLNIKIESRPSLLSRMKKSLH